MPDVDGTIVDGAVTTAKIAANAITKFQTADGTTDINSTSTTYVDMTDMSLSVTVDSDTAYVLILFSASIRVDGSAPGEAKLQLVDGSTVLQKTTVTVPASTSQGAAVMDWVGSPSATTHTFKVQWRLSIGTQMFVDASSGQAHRRLIVIQVKK